MRTLYLDCGMGAAGDMLTAALLELLDDKEGFLAQLNALLDGLAFSCETTRKCGIKGTHMKVTFHGEEEGEPTHSHTHRGMRQIGQILQDLPVSEQVKKDALAVYALIAEAESHVHGTAVSQIHFHELGQMDAIADITAVCMLMERLAPERVIASPVHVGSGHVKCAHGMLPVPAPATAYILKDVPIYGGQIQGELCTPTGAALLKHFAAGFGDMPVMRTEAIGYGMGKKDFPVANCVRALLGQTEDGGDMVAELCCNLDDMTGEAVAFAGERLFEAGALDVYTVPVQMKKSRPGVLLCVMCRQEDRDAMLRLIFKHTTTLGVRETVSRRHTLRRRIETAETPMGTVRKKVSEGFGVKREKYEYEDLAKIARERDMSLRDVADKL